MAAGEKLHINLAYMDRDNSSFEHQYQPDEYGEFILATFQHLQSKYGWVPDSVETVIEPDGPGKWLPAAVGYTLAAAGNRLRSHGYTPDFIAPSTMRSTNALPYLDAAFQAPDARRYLSELSYHRYGGDPTKAELQSIADRARSEGLRTSMLELVGADHADLHRDLAFANVSAWQQYTLTYPTNDNGGQYYVIDISNRWNPVVLTGSRTKLLRQYFKFIRPDASRIGATSNRAKYEPLAFINSDGRYVVVVKASNGGSFSVRGLPAGIYGIKYTTDGEYDVDLPETSIAAGQEVHTTIPDGGVITIYGLSGNASPSPSNQPPVVDAGPDQQIALSDGAFLDGTATDDGLPNPPGRLPRPGASTAGRAVSSSPIPTTSTRP